MSIQVVFDSFVAGACKPLSACVYPAARLVHFPARTSFIKPYLALCKQAMLVSSHFACFIALHREEAKLLIARHATLCPQQAYCGKGAARVAW